MEQRPLEYTVKIYCEGFYPMGDADRRAATGKVVYSKPNQGKYRCIRF